MKASSQAGSYSKNNYNLRN